MNCDGITAISATAPPGQHTASQWAVTNRLSMDAGKHCADITIYKPATSTATTFLFSQGYNVPCAQVTTNPRVSSRGIEAHYTGI